MNYRVISAAATAVVLGCLCVPAIAQSDYPGVVHYQNHDWSDGSYRYTGGEHVVLTGTVIRVSDRTGRFALRSDADRRYAVDTYNAEIVTADANSDDATQIETGDRVRVVGYRFGIGRVDADRIDILSNENDIQVDPVPAASPAPVDPPVTIAPAAPVDATPLPPVAPAQPDGSLRMEGVINAVGADGKLTVTGADGAVYQVKTADADIILPFVNRAGSLADLDQGMHVRIIGERTGDGIIDADRIRVVRDEEVPVTIAPAPRPAITDLSVYTGIIIDARGTGIERSPSPAIYGPDMALLYPDRTHVPTPDEVQDESIVRYYRSEDAAEAGVGGSHPLILQAEQIVGPAHDGVMLSADDAALFKALDQRLGYSKNWKVGFLIPADQ